MSEPWTNDEIKKLRSLHIDPVRRKRNDLIFLVNHFKAGGGIWAVCEGSKDLSLASRVYARKIRDLTAEGNLDWLLNTDPGEDIEEAPSKEKSLQAPADKIHLDHWARIGRVAEKLTQGLSLIELKNPIESRFGGVLVDGDYFFNPKKTPAISFSAEKNKLWECFLQHMSAEYESFRDEFRQYKETASRLLIENTDEYGYQDPRPVWTCQETEKLNEKLWLVVERGTFKGTCDICKDWIT